ncbi:MAG: glycoside hydrolase family 2 protein [Ferruginibacter sp.]|nr:glycoside hydrolase family 2 protein [Ferruginibacter sp.]
MSNRFLVQLSLSFFITGLQAQNPPGQHKISFNKNWMFVKDVDTLNAIQSFSGNTIVWEKISLPHTPRIEPVEKKEEQWQGTCYYQKDFRVAALDKGKHIALQFDAAMHEADVYLNGQHVFKHVGGYLPFYIDITGKVKFGLDNKLIIKLNNQDNADIPPAKPIKELDFNYYGGIYRNAWFIIKDKLHIADAIEANREAGGGVLLHYEAVSDIEAKLIVQTEVKNDYNQLHKVRVKLILTDQKGNEIAATLSEVQAITDKNYVAFNQQLIIQRPKLWSPENPYLYNLTIQVIKDGKVIDQEIIKTGVKTFRFETGSFILNGKKLMLRGTNRHQEYPYIGYALPDNAQYRDAYKIKEAGFNFVRCSHYPPSPAFLNACDELGILVMNAIPGWQFFGKEAFQVNSLQNIRDMIHRDRNHASIILWEASLNETRMSKEYKLKSHEIVHKELPFGEVYSCGWTEDIYDVFIPARQHAKAPDYWKKYTKKPLLIAEYGDWEYYAQNAGFNQKEYKDLKEVERTSRQLRGTGEKGLLQQALNYQESHNDNLNGPATGDANWLIFDYKRGYAADIESSGISDINRLPKFSYYFYQSQYRKRQNVKSEFGNPMIFIASYWNNPASAEIKVFSNCDEVELLLNGKTIARQWPDRDKLSNKLLHPPFTFQPVKFEPGTLTAIGYNNAKETVRTERKTPSLLAGIKLSIDYSGRYLQTGEPDLLLVYARIVDANGTLVPGAEHLIKFSVKGNAALIGINPIKAEAGIATILLKTGEMPGEITISANAENIKGGSVKVSTNAKQ